MLSTTGRAIFRKYVSLLGGNPPFHALSPGEIWQVLLAPFFADAGHSVGPFSEPPVSLSGGKLLVYPVCPRREKVREAYRLAARSDSLQGGVCAVVTDYELSELFEEGERRLVIPAGLMGTPAARSYFSSRRYTGRDRLALELSRRAEEGLSSTLSGLKRGCSPTALSLALFSLYLADPALLPSGERDPVALALSSANPVLGFLDALGGADVALTGGSVLLCADGELWLNENKLLKALTSLTPWRPDGTDLERGLSLLSRTAGSKPLYEERRKAAGLLLNPLAERARAALGGLRGGAVGALPGPLLDAGASGGELALALVELCEELSERVVPADTSGQTGLFDLSEEGRARAGLVHRLSEPAALALNSLYHGVCRDFRSHLATLLCLALIALHRRVRLKANLLRGDLLFPHPSRLEAVLPSLSPKPPKADTRALARFPSLFSGEWLETVERGDTGLLLGAFRRAAQVDALSEALRAALGDGSGNVPDTCAPEVLFGSPGGGGRGGVSLKRFSTVTGFFGRGKPRGTNERVHYIAEHYGAGRTLAECTALRGLSLLAEGGELALAVKGGRIRVDTPLSSRPLGVKGWGVVEGRL